MSASRDRSVALWLEPERCSTSMCHRTVACDRAALGLEWRSSPCWRNSSSRWYCGAVLPSSVHHRLREAAGSRSYRHVAELTQTHPESVRRYMQSHSPSFEFIAAFCGALGVSADWLIHGHGPMLARDIPGRTLTMAEPGDLLQALAQQLELFAARLARVEAYAERLAQLVGSGDRPAPDGAALRELKGIGEQAGSPVAGLSPEASAGTMRAGVRRDDRSLGASGLEPAPLQRPRSDAPGLTAADGDPIG